MKEYNFQFPKLGKLKLDSIWQKGKKDLSNRYLFIDEEGKEMILWFSANDFPIKGAVQVEWMDIEKSNYKTTEHIKNTVYNYYKLKDQSNKEVELEKEIKNWLNPNSLFPETLSSYCHVTIDRINYKPVIY